MIRLSRVTDYGIVVMARLASGEDAGAESARELAEDTHLPAPMVSKILKSLAREGLLVSQRGAKGGYSLARPADEITAAEMIAALEGPIGLVECTMHPGQCPQESSCHVREPWQRINDAVRLALENVTLADLANEGALAPPTVPLRSLGVDTANIVER